ncbi:hypothetical protein DUNSADRAFT_9224 [Dunaliella salina]|uniref:EF-hand domain-containing protein n=1 Tax=Dunaliella salina TaxID=3046 RepID=A0ABQ7GI22_DUNSA|nr:hypothetical protein DUNSADRAFT_9224 [Dunaliella salina]|eukprot:KAF5834194.1 hypothetical protein DUNSADRAFT_9224 [Dunaliella salina]
MSYGGYGGYGHPSAPPAPYGHPAQAAYGHPSPAYGQPAPSYAQPHGGKSTADMDAVRAWFMAIDLDRSGELNSGELQRALSMGQLNFSLTDVDSMIRAFDTNGRRKLNIEEFAKLHSFLTSFGEVLQALKHAGFTLDPPVVQAMMHRHDPDNDTHMKLDDFIRMCLFLQSCVRTFGAFDAQRTGRITLDFGQFVYAASHIS